MKTYKNIVGRQINVHTKPMAPNALIRIETVDNEIKNLVKNGYLSEVAMNKPKGTLK